MPRGSRCAVRWSTIGGDKIRCNDCGHVARRADRESGRIDARREYLRDGIATAFAEQREQLMKEFERCDGCAEQVCIEHSAKAKMMRDANA